MKRTLIPIIGILASLALVTGACSTSSVDTAAGNEEAKLPAGFSLASMKSAIQNYVNDMMWFYPEQTHWSYADNNFETFIGQTIDVEARLYTDGSDENRIFANTGLGEKLALFALKDGYVYVEGQVGENDPEFGPKGNFEIVGAFSFRVEQPRKPNYGSSPRKDKMIVALEAKMKKVCEDLLSGSDKDDWIGSKIYIMDFYEYESFSSAWIVRPDGYAWNEPLQLVEKDDGFAANGGKGLQFDNIRTLDTNDVNRIAFEQGIQQALKTFTCDVD
ncbi:MAG: hypothetical protein J7559_11855 [Cohnella sp.]|nr:hypothetical protein [Cohnella sp.]